MGRQCNVHMWSEWKWLETRLCKWCLMILLMVEVGRLRSTGEKRIANFNYTNEGEKVEMVDVGDGKGAFKFR